MKKRIITEADYLAELAAVKTTRPTEAAFTTQEAADKTGLGIKAMENKLKADVAAGLLCTKLQTWNGRLTRFYWLAK